MSENIKDVKGYEGLYAVSEDGRIWSYPKKYICKRGAVRCQHNGMWMTIKGNRRYLKVKLYKNGKEKHHSIHRLVAEAHIPNLENKPMVNHLDGDRKNNHISNLEWATYSEDQIHAYKIGLQKPQCGEKHGRSKLKNNDVIFIRNLHKTGYHTNRELAGFFNVSDSHISDIVNRKLWRHI